VQDGRLLVDRAQHGGGKVARVLGGVGLGWDVAAAQPHVVGQAVRAWQLGEPPVFEARYVV